MSGYIIKIETGNAAFEDYPELEIARLLREIADNAERGYSLNVSIYDHNGNRVGNCEMVAGDG
jgi:hypothetical protein